ncbi:serine/threonine-protein kinase Nek6 [Striga asiatica]|uniref:Serine/threonine-protein kinase Nek6 n=1 Tax=Striga asiatica TaxID=4170 RepID=A0A5A7NZE7_STRAF|nr:serine/threonine-protein kinase Nek6 [Striga asiatica]
MDAESLGFESKMKDYEVIENIGRGAFGALYLVLHKTDHKKYVLRKIRLSKYTEKFKSKACQEVDLIANLRHPYILEYKDAWVDKESCICVVTSYCELGNISEIMKKAKRGSHFPEEKLCKWLTQLLLAIDYLHSNRVLHRDLKLSNIFITKENDIRLGDFGLAKLLNEEGLASSVDGTPNYMCPELLADAPYCYKSDIWSLGCCMFEMAARQQAFRAPDMAGLINKINRSLISPLPIVYSSNLKQIIKSMLRKSPEHRPTPYVLKCHNLSTVFLPVKSPSTNNTKDKTGNSSPGCSSCTKESKDHKQRRTKVKQQKELLPLFDENNSAMSACYPNLLDDTDFSIDVHLETKRVDPTSYSGKISSDGEDSKSGDRARIINGDIKGNPVVSSLESGPDNKWGNTDAVIEKVVDLELARRAHVTGEAKLKPEDNNLHTQGKVDKEPSVNVRLEKADALESLLELCAKLLKQDKFDELNGVLKPFGDDIVSSRETAILLTKSLMNAQKKLAKET